jgi:hypothetical protein
MNSAREPRRRSIEIAMAGLILHPELLTKKKNNEMKWKRG